MKETAFFSLWLFHYLCVPFSCFATPMLLYFQHNEKFIVIRFSRLILFQAKCDLWLWPSWMEMVGTVSNFTDLPDALSHLGLVAWKTPFYLSLVPFPQSLILLIEIYFRRMPLRMNCENECNSHNFAPNGKVLKFQNKLLCCLYKHVCELVVF